jgi:hypothetical protein
MAYISPPNRVAEFLTKSIDQLLFLFDVDQSLPRPLKMASKNSYMVAVPLLAI